MFPLYFCSALLILVLGGCSSNFELQEGDNRRSIVLNSSPAEALSWYKNVPPDTVCQEWASFKNTFYFAKQRDTGNRNYEHIANSRGIRCLNKEPKRTVAAPTPANDANQGDVDLQRLQNLNNYLQSLPGGTNYKPPRSCPFLTAETKDNFNTYCIYDCTDGTTKTVTQGVGMRCM